MKSKKNSEKLLIFCLLSAQNNPFGGYEKGCLVVVVLSTYGSRESSKLLLVRLFIRFAF